MSKNKIISVKDVLKEYKTLENEFAVVFNPAGIFPEKEYYILPKKITKVKTLHGVVMDMDGTTTTTEELCIHSLEFMVRKITGKLSTNVWAGLDHTIDYPHIIGNSTTKHVEYLINTYGNNIVKKDLISSFIYAALWTVLFGKDEGRIREVKNNLQLFNCYEILSDQKLTSVKTVKQLIENTNYFIKKYASKTVIESFELIVKASIDIYYQRYHEILEEMKKGNGKKIAKTVLHDENKRLIEPMPGVALFLTILKGLIPDEIQIVIEQFISENNLKLKNKSEVINKILKTASMFRDNPVKVAVVTSSIRYEADIVLTELFSVMRDEILTWNISKKSKASLLKTFSSYLNFYDAFITATDSNEIRLKPHRDLYSIALNMMGISSNNFDKVLGLEDSESGTFAIRAAGIGLCCAVPFAKTSGHQFEAASYVAINGLPEVIFNKNIFIK